MELYESVNRNKRNSLLLMLLMLAVVFATAWAISYLVNMGAFGAILALVIAFAYAIGGYYYSDKIVLSMSGAKPADRRVHAHYVNTVEGLAIAAGIPSPAAYVIEDDAPNAFATGRDPQHAAVAVTTGLLKTMDRYELEGVLAHELSHVKNYDVRFATIAVVLVGAVAIMGDIAIRMMFFGGGRRDGKGGNAILMVVGIALIILAPIFAQLVHLAISRKREFLADASAVQLTRNPLGLSSALEKIGKSKMRVKNATDATASLYIANPIPNKLMSLFSTHPPIEERIAALKRIG
ncbi:M48 family metallopeptidase [Candidatus Micrarchaeota archaeon]|nr:M48 family metallopeptidase [Candidatus Micrarchaeota archaeon]